MSEDEPSSDRTSLSEVTCHRLSNRAESCDLCFCSLSSPDITYSWAEGRAICDPCQERFEFEPTKVNQTIGLVRRGFYADGIADPGHNTEGRG